jgi:hypothetical protein
LRVCASEPLDLPLTGVVGRESQVPVAEHPVEVFQVRRGGMGRLLGVGALVDPGIDAEAVAPAGSGDELEDPLGLRSGVRVRLERAFDVSHEDEILRNSGFSKTFWNVST